MEWLHVTSPGDRLCPVKQLVRYKSDTVHSSSDRKIGPLPTGYELRGKARAPIEFKIKFCWITYATLGDKNTRTRSLEAINLITSNSSINMIK